MYHYVDDDGHSLTIKSTWKNSKKMKDNACQTSAENDYITHDSTIQTGLATISISKEVKAKDDGASLLAYCKGRLKKYDDQTWLSLLDQGTVTIDEEITKTPSQKVHAESVIGYTDYMKEMGCQTMSTSSNTDFDGLDEDDETVALKLKQEKDVIQMLRKNADMVLDELSNNSNSLIDEYINSKSSFMNTNTNKDCAYDASYFKRLHVDMTKFRVVYPDWSTSKHAEYHSGRILKCDVTRVGDRIYDVVCTEHTKGFRQNKATGMTTKIPNVREEYIRIAASQMQLKSHSSHNKGHLTVGIRVFALVPEKHSRSGHHAREQYYYPGTVERVKNSTYDIRMQHSGKLVEGLTVDDILTNGLLVDQEIETKKPNIPELQCTSCTWNGTGSSIAVSYGQTTNINGWCNVPGCVAIWNLNSRSFDPNAPTYLLDYPSAITTVKFHPEKPSIVVAGTVNGEVIVWDLTEQTTVVNVLTSSSDDAVYGTNKETSGGLKMNSKHDTLSVDPVCISVIDEFSHKEPIMDLQWLMSNSSITNHVHSHMKSKTKYVQNKLILPDSYILTSIAADGKLLFWSLTNKLAHPIKGYLLSNYRSGSKKSSTYPIAAGGMSITYPGSFMNQRSMKPKWIVIGQEGGHIVRSPVVKLLPNGAGNSVQLLTPDSFANVTYADEVYTSISKAAGSNSKGDSFNYQYEAHIGNVNSVDSSGFYRGIFISAGNDGLVKIFNLLDRTPLKSFDVPNNTVFDSSSHGHGDGHDGLVHPQVVYATGTNASIPMGSAGTVGIGKHCTGQGVDTTYASASAVRFSPSNPVLFAVSSLNGNVYFYDISTHTTTPVLILNSSMVPTPGEDSDASNANPTPNNAGMSCIAFNRVQTNYFAVGSTDGAVHIWKLNNKMLQPKPISSMTTGNDSAGAANEEEDASAADMSQLFSN